MILKGRFGARFAARRCPLPSCLQPNKKPDCAAMPVSQTPLAKYLNTHTLVFAGTWEFCKSAKIHIKEVRPACCKEKLCQHASRQDRTKTLSYFRAIRGSTTCGSFTSAFRLTCGRRGSGQSLLTVRSKHLSVALWCIDHVTSSSLRPLWCHTLRKVGLLQSVWSTVGVRRAEPAATCDTVTVRKFRQPRKSRSECTFE